MGEAFPIVKAEMPSRQLSHYLDKKIPAVMVETKAGDMQILTQYDIIQAV
jgi:predicted transcriptional regulator